MTINGNFLYNLYIFVMYTEQELSQDSIAHLSCPLSSYDGQKPFTQLTLWYGVHNLRLCYGMIMF